MKWQGFSEPDQGWFVSGPGFYCEHGISNATFYKLQITG